MEKYIIFGLLILPFLSGCFSTGPNEQSCRYLDDCACGTRIKTGECFFGNKAFVNVEKQCPDFCTGIGGNLQVSCVANKCQQVNVKLDEGYCDADSDCVTKKECCPPCDIKEEKYINKKYQVEINCEGISCPQCIAVRSNSSTIKCIDNTCTAMEAFCGTSTLGACSTDSDCVKGGCSGQVCQSKNEKQLATTCEYRDCYDADAYNLGCKCVSNKCQWEEK
jgi:eight-cysteine-cluster-containing protein